LPPQLLSAEPHKELDEVPTFLYVGGDNYVKGFHILLQALGKLGNQGVKARFILTNTYRPKSLEKLKRLNEKYNNLQIGVIRRLKHEQLVKLHRKAWILIFPSICEETFGYAVAEAMLLGTIPIASKVGGIPEVVKDTPAERMLLTPRDPLELSEFVESALGLTLEQLKALGTEIKESIYHKFSLCKIERRLMQEFEG